MKTDLSKYSRNSNFYKPKAFLVTVKSFEMQKIRERYLKSRKSKTGRIGSVERREVTQGGLVYIEIDSGLISDYEILSFLPEPRGIDVAQDMVAVSTENVVHLIKEHGIERIDNPWFSYIHTVQFNHCHSADRLLVSSSGFDCIFEYDLSNFQKTWEWFAWEHGFKKGIDPETGKQILLTRGKEEASYFRVTRKNHLYISDPEKQVLPTAQRAAFINSVLYDCNHKSKLLATLFHEGSVYTIDMKTGNCKLLIDGMKSPHGGRNFKDIYMATSTASGELRFSNGEKISFANLPGKPEELLELEWLQNSAPFDDCIITIDANRNSFILIDTVREQYDQVPFDPNWAIQDIAEIKDPETKKLVKKIKELL
jgi:hypothetical protein